MAITVLLLAEFADPGREQRGVAVVDDLLMRRLAAAAISAGGRQLAALPRQLLLTFGTPAAARQFALQLLTAVDSHLKLQADAGAGEVRLVIGAGPTEFDAQGRAHGAWIHRLAGAVLRVPSEGIGVLDNLFPVDPQLPPMDALRRLGEGLYLLHPRESEAAQETRMASPLDVGDVVFTEITLRVRGQDRRFRAADCPLLIGRSSDCAIQVAAEGASRQHGRIVYEKGRFYFQDDSRNGTWVLTGGGEEVALRKDRQLLTGEGALSLGAPIGRQTGEVLRFVCRSQRLRMDAAAGDTRPLAR